MKKQIFSSLMLLLLVGNSTALPHAAAAPNTPPTFTVNSFADAVAAAPLNSGPCETATGNGICTLRAAIMKANHYPGGGAIVNLPTAGTYNLTISPTGSDDETTGDLNVTASMTITGVSAASTIINANQIDRVFYADGYTVSMSRMTIQNGKADTGGGIEQPGGQLNLDSIVVSNNTAKYSGGGIWTGSGFGLRVSNSTINNNTTTAGEGGGLFSESTSFLINTTISNNSATTNGGGIDAYAGSLTAFFTTIVGNLADSDANATGTGGGIYVFTSNPATAAIRSTLLAQNYVAATANDCSGTTSSQGYNLVQTTSGCSITGVTTGNITGVSDALIDSLNNNGGQTPTRALLSGSQAINAIPTGNCVDDTAAPLTRDQRGNTRPSGGACDMGAYEGSVPIGAYGRNLVRNGDAEASAGSPTGALVGMPNWTKSYSGTVVAYGGSAGFPDQSSSAAISGGYGFLAGGASSDEYLQQNIDVSAHSADINAGKVYLTTSVDLGGYLSDDDTVTVLVGFCVDLNCNGTLAGGVYFDAVHPADRSYQTKFVARSGTSAVSSGAVAVRLRLTFHRASGAYDDAYVDNLSVALWNNRVLLPLILR